MDEGYDNYGNWDVWDVLDDIEIPRSISEHADDMTNKWNRVWNEWRLSGVMVDVKKLSCGKYNNRKNSNCKEQYSTASSDLQRLLQSVHGRYLKDNLNATTVPITCELANT